MIKLEQGDYEFFHKLASTNNALTLSVSDPIVITEYIPFQNQLIGRDIFYDCYEDEDEEKAEGIMRRRLETAREDIDAHIRLHKRMLDIFYSIDESMNARNRGKVAGLATNLCDELINYSGLVEKHIARLGGLAFLNYPYAQGGRFFTSARMGNEGGRSILAYLSFNSNKTKDGLAEEVQNLREIAPEFNIRSDPIQRIQLGDHDTGEGTMDTSYRGRLELTKELLKRAEKFVKG